MAPILEVSDLVKVYSTAADEAPRSAGISIVVEPASSSRSWARRARASRRS